MRKYKLKKKLVSLILSLLIMATTGNVANAAVLFEYELCRVENTEKFQYVYDGLIQTNLSTYYNGGRADRGYIRYSGGKSGDTGRLYTPYSRGILL